MRAGGRINLIIGRSLTAKAREAWACRLHPVPPAQAPGTPAKGFTLAQKMVGRACACPKARASPGTYCEPKMTTVGSRTPPAR